MSKTTTAAAAFITALLAAALTACGGQQAVTYAPAAYGAAGQCYYIDSPAEAVALEQAGLCPSIWAPALMPLAWHETYWDYYDSPAYYDTYVPAASRTVYIHQQTTFGRTYHTAIVTRARTATYRTSTGQTVKGTQVTAKAKFGSGTSFGPAGQKYGGGNLRTKPTPGAAKANRPAKPAKATRGRSLRSGHHR